MILQVVNNLLIRDPTYFPIKAVIGGGGWFGEASGYLEGEVDFGALVGEVVLGGWINLGRVDGYVVWITMVIGNSSPKWGNMGPLINGLSLTPWRWS